MIWEALIKSGFNAIPVDAEKRPLGGAFQKCYEEHCPDLLKRFESREVKKRQTGVALMGRINPRYPEAVLLIVDVDDPKAFPEEARDLLRGAWHWLTGPRCPKDGEKHGIVCERGVCRHGDHEFPLAEAVRGEAFAVLIPAEAERLIAKGVVRALNGAVELKLRGLQLMPPSVHPSGVVYEWISEPPRTPEGAVILPRELTMEETQALLKALGVEPPAEPQPAAPVRTAVGQAAGPWRRLEERARAEAAALLKDVYTPGRRQALWLTVSGWLAKARVDPRDAADILKRLYYETGDEDDLKTRGSAVVYTYAKAGHPDPRTAVAEALGVVPYAPSEAEQKTIKGLSGIREIAAEVMGPHAAAELVRRLKAVLRRRVLPVDYDLAKMPQWAWRIEIRLKRVCLERNALHGFCAKELRVVKDPVSQYVDIVLLFRARVCAKNDAGVKECKTAVVRVVKVARLLRFMGRVYDPFYGEARYVALKDGRVAASAPADDFDSFVEQIRQTPPCFVVRDEKMLDILKAYLPNVSMPLSAGLTDDGFVDPHGVLDLSDYGAENTLLPAWRWMKKAYRGRNLGYAAFNVLAAGAKLMTPLIRRVNKTFVDSIVYNVGRGGEGKSSLVRYVLTPLLGGDEAQEAYHVRLDGPVRTEAQLRNLLDMNRLVLFLDEQTRRALISNAAMFLAASVGAGVVGIHASRHGHGISARFRNLRGLVLFTNVPLTAFLREVAAEASDAAFARRFIEIRWDFAHPDPSAFDELPDVKPVFGFVVRLWTKYRDELAKARDLLELVEKLADVLVREHPGDAEVAELATAVKYTVAEIREEKRTERAALTDEAMLIERAYAVAAEQLKATQLSAIRVVRYILENPHVFGIAFSKMRDEQRAREAADDLEDLIAGIKKMYTVRHDSQGHPVIADDAAVVISILEKLIEEKRVQAVIFAKSPLIPGAPRMVLGSAVGIYTDPVSKTKRHGYALKLATFIKLFLDSNTTDSADDEKTQNEEASDFKNSVEVAEMLRLRFTLDTSQESAGQTGEMNTPNDSADVKSKAQSQHLNHLNQNFEGPGGQHIGVEKQPNSKPSAVNEPIAKNVKQSFDEQLVDDPNRILDEGMRCLEIGDAEERSRCIDETLDKLAKLSAKR